MANKTVLQIAQYTNKNVYTILESLKKIGIYYENASDIVSDEEQKKLFNYLGISDSKEIKIKDPSCIEIIDKQSYKSLLAISKLSDNSFDKKKLDANTEKLLNNNISLILNNLPNLAKSVKGLTTYEAVFSSEMKELINSGVATLRTDNSGEILPHIVHTGTEGRPNQVIKQVRLKSGMSPANFALIAWQIASMITAQKHLSDINKKLEEISKEVKIIYSFLEDEFHSEIETELNYAKELVVSIADSKDFFHEFDRFHANHIVSTIKKIDTLSTRLNKLIHRKLEIFNSVAMVDNNSEKVVKKFNSYKNEITILINLNLQLIQAQHILCIVYDLYSENSSYTKQRYKTIEDSFEILMETLNEFNTLCLDKIKTFDTKMTWYEKVFGIPVALIVGVVALPGIAIWEGLSKFDVVEGIDWELEIDKTKKLQLPIVNNEFKTIKHNINAIKENMKNREDSLKSESKFCFDLDSKNNISNIRLIDG